MNYRLFQPDDFHDLYAIEELCFQPPQRFTRRYMRQLLDSPEAATWVTEHGQTMTGFAIIEWSLQVTGIVAYIATIEILPEYRGKGIGAELDCGVSKALPTPNVPSKSGCTSTRKTLRPSIFTAQWVPQVGPRRSLLRPQSLRGCLCQNSRLNCHRRVTPALRRSAIQ